MKNFFFKKVLFVGVIGFLSAGMVAQISISNVAMLSKVKEGTTYLAMKDPTNAASKVYVAAAEKHWTFSKLVCISYKEVEQHIAPNASFITIGGSMSDRNNSAANAETRVYLEFWTTNGTFLYDPTKRRHFDLNDKIVLATAELFPDYLLQANPSLLYKFDYDFRGHLKNWNEGTFANQLQQLCKMLEDGNPRTYKDEFRDDVQLQMMASSTLYLPDYIFTKFEKNSGNEKEKLDEKALLKDYPYSYKVVLETELIRTINDIESNIYYLSLIKSGTNRFITITNSKTGRLLYSSFATNTSTLKASDFKVLAKAID